LGWGKGRKRKKKGGKRRNGTGGEGRKKKDEKRETVRAAQAAFIFHGSRRIFHFTPFSPF
jgi:hypothetical protein